MLRRRLDGDSEINWRHDMPSDIVYARINEGAMLDRPFVTSLSINELMSNRLFHNEKTDLRRIFQAGNQSKSFKNNMSDVLPDRMLILTGRMRSCLPLTHNKTWRSRIWADSATKSYAVLTISDFSRSCFFMSCHLCDIE